jgi:hypothetical protein
MSRREHARGADRAPHRARIADPRAPGGGALVSRVPAIAYGEDSPMRRADLLDEPWSRDAARSLPAVRAR